MPVIHVIALICEAISHYQYSHVNFFPAAIQQLPSYYQAAKQL